mmetsp:Transcript_17676/g.35239  ORF Transcript_17676/g.35239 Transcript_17676/m.35239 type:complete len:465 (+) Transcript_17676:220-1614(+)
MVDSCKSFPEMPTRGPLHAPSLSSSPRGPVNDLDASPQHRRRRPNAGGAAALLLLAFALPTHALTGQPTSPHTRAIGRRCPRSRRTTLLRSSEEGYWTRQTRRRRGNASIPAPKPERWRPLWPEEEVALLAAAQQSMSLQALRRSLALETLPRIPTDLEWARAAGIDSDELSGALAAGEKAMESIMTSHMGLVRSVVADASPYGRRGALDHTDLVQEGCLGLSRAVAKYDRRKTNSGRFATYATYWIRAAVLRAQAQHGSEDGIRLPEGVGLEIRRVLALRLDLRGAGAGTDARRAAIAKDAGVRVEVVGYAADVQGRRRAGSKRIESASAPGPCAREGNREAVRDKISPYLDAKELRALELRYGLRDEASGELRPRTNSVARDYVGEVEEKWFVTGSNGKVEENWFAKTPVIIAQGEDLVTFREMGVAIGVSAEYCRKLCNRALDKLRAAAEEGSLELDFDLS